MPLEPSVATAVTGSGVFFLSGLLTGIWKWRQVLSSPEHRAHIYVDIAHRASLMYAFSALLLGVFAHLSAWSATVDLVATAVPLFYFATAIATYLWHATKRDTENQYEERNFITTWGTALLVLGEVGGFLVLFVGTLKTIY
jgi:FtsH-binding integral membrane protein